MVDCLPSRWVVAWTTVINYSQLYWIDFGAGVPQLWRAKLFLIFGMELKAKKLLIKGARIIRVIANVYVLYSVIHVNNIIEV